MEDKIKEYLSDEELEKLVLDVEAHSMLSAPSYLKDEIVEQVVQEQKREKQKRIHKKLSLWLYSAEVGLVAAAAIAFMFLIPTENKKPESGNHMEQESVSVINRINQKSNDLCGHLFEMTNQIVTWEEN